MSIATRVLRDWSGIIFVVALIIGLLGEPAELSPRTVIFLGIAVLAYVLLWHNFARLAAVAGSLSYRRGLPVAAVGIAAPFLAAVDYSIAGRVGWVLLGLAMLAVARTILRGPPLPDGFAWLSGFFGIAMVVVVATRGENNISAGPVFVVIGWSISMSVMYILWGHPEDHNTGRHIRR